MKKEKTPEGVPWLFWLILLVFIIGIIFSEDYPFLFKEVIGVFNF
jgi:hypothetical protein